jgi:high-affinity iron transporter
MNPRLLRDSLYLPSFFQPVTRTFPDGLARRLRGLMLSFLVSFVPLQASGETTTDAATLLHLLDYIAVDYAEAVQDGRIKNADEYKEMAEFSTQAAARIARLPDNPQRAALAAKSQSLIELISGKAEPAEVAAAASALRWAVIRTYNLSVAPRRTPQVTRGAALYQQHCTACHGVDGRGDGPAAKGMEPAPSSFHDAERMAQRSAHGLYNTITLGVDGTGMASFRQLSEDDRWALAFHTASYPLAAARAKGEALWNAGERGALGLNDVATLSSNEMRAKLGDAGAFLQAALLASPQWLDAGKPSPLAFTRQKLADSLATYRAGDRAQAMTDALTAYLEGFELVEPALANIDGTLTRDIERGMLALRGQMQANAPPSDIENRMANIRTLLDRAEATLQDGGMSPAAIFLASLFILLREGIEAILVVAAILAFLAKAGRPDARRYVHAGWLLALGLGGVTWVIATHVVRISGADREVTEGVTALIAAGMLLYVGFWLHSKSHAAAWQQFIKSSVGGALSRGTLATLVTISFLAVYREAFETVLFYQALFAQAGAGGPGPILAGMAAAAALLAVIAWLILKASVRLPLSQFFAWRCLPWSSQDMVLPHCRRRAASACARSISSACRRLAFIQRWKAWARSSPC